MSELATNYIRQRWSRTPRVGLVLGTGLGNLANQIVADAALPYRDIPDFPHSTALSHAGRLVCGSLHGIPVVAMEGRCHLYEGYRWDQITLPVRVMRSLGAELLIVSNASGGVNPQLKSGEIVVIVDHIDLMRTRDASVRWASSAADNAAPHHRLQSVYDAKLVETALEVARREGFPARRGVYAAFTGPNYETRSEYRCLRRIGADVVGMSTIPEVIVAAQLQMRVLALSVVTNVANPDSLAKTTGEEVVEIARRAELHLRAIVTAALSQFTDA